jgi:hypothetical protein
MNCENCQLELEDLFYGELPSGQTAELREHLAGCAECRGVEATIARETEIFSRYYTQTELEPPAQMWEAIRDQIRTEEPDRVARRGWGERFSGGLFGWLLQPVVLRQAAAALALILVTVAVTVFLTSRKDEKQSVAEIHSTPTPAPSPAPSVTVTPAPAPTSNQTGEFVAKDNGRAPVKNERLARPTPAPKTLSDEQLIRAQVARAEREYVSAIRLLDRAVAQRKGQIDNSVYAQYEESLALIDDSIEKSRNALRAHPGDTSAGQFLLTAYARKVELMQEFVLR